MKKFTLILLFLSTTFSFSQNNWDGDAGVPTGIFTDNSNWFGNIVPFIWNPTTNLEFHFNNGNQTAVDYNFTNWVPVKDIIYHTTYVPSPFLPNSIVELRSSTTKGLIFDGKIENYSPQTQHLSLELGYSGAGNIELNPVNGNLIFSNTLFNPLNRNYEVYGSNFKTLRIVGDLQGAGSKLTIRDESIVIINNSFNSFGGGIDVKKGELWLESNTIIAGKIRVGAGNAKDKKVYISNPSASTAIPNEIVIPNNSRYVFIGAFNNIGIHEYAGRIKINSNNLNPVFFDEVDLNGTLLLSGKITSNPAGSGIFEKIGAGRIIINNNTNTFSGLTKITDGFLQLGDGGLIGKINGAIENNAELIFNRSNNRTFSHNIYGTGNIDKIGSNALRFRGTVSCTGITTVTNGKLVIDGSGVFSGGQLTVKNGAEFLIKTNDVEITDLIVETGGKVIVFPNATLTVINGIVNDGLISVRKKGSLVQVNDAATNTGSGIFRATVAINTIPVNAINPAQSSRYTYFSSPVQGKTLNVFNNWAEMGSLYNFDASIQNWQSKTSATTMAKGIGYIVRNKELASSYPFDGSTLAKGLTQFTGTFNNGISTHALTFNAGGTDDDSTLLGNPYPSAISTAQIFTDNTSVGALHFWRHAQGADADGNFNESYAVRTSILSTFGAPINISTGQGFFAEASASGNLVFKNNMRISGNNNTFLRPTPQNLDIAWFNITTATGVEAQVAIGFIPTCTDGFDNQHDAHNIDSGSYLQMYTNGVGNNAQNLVIQARAPLSDTDSVIPLGFDMDNPSITNLTISLDHYENFDGYDMYLRDLQENILHDIKQGDYNFTVNQTGSFNNRFEILFNKNVASINENLISNNNLIISNQENNIIKVRMSDKNIINKLEAYDILGKLIINKTPKMNSFEIETSVKSGTILFIKASLDNGQIISKKFIKI